MIMLSFTQVESNYSKKEPYDRSCSRIITFSHCSNFIYVNMVLLFFQFELKMAVCIRIMKKKICEMNNSSFFFKKS